MANVSSRVNFDAQKFLEKLKAGLVIKLDKVGERLVENAKANLSRKGPEFWSRSEPGDDFPFLHKGDLRESVRHVVDADELKVEVGTDLIYGRLLETGALRGKTITRRDPTKWFHFVDQHGDLHVRQTVTLGPIEPRPWLRVTLESSKAEIRTIVGQKQ